MRGDNGEARRGEGILSPLTWFFMVMEVFYTILQHKIDAISFTYHLRVKLLLMIYLFIVLC